MSTGIEWTDETWNPTTGCDRVSAGCDNCYALGMAKRLKAMGSADYQTDGDPKTSGPGFGLAIHPHRLDQPLRWKKPRKVFVNSMSDLFHKDIPDEYLVKVFDVMQNAHRHTFQILTKRHARMRSFVTRYLSGEFATKPLDEAPLGRTVDNPPPNIWLGVSVEDQKWADIRIPSLLETPASVRFLSCEPLLGPVNAQPYFWSGDETGPLPGVDWVIVGGESGHGARPMHPDWARDLRDQCTAADLPYLFKQWGDSSLWIDKQGDVWTPGVGELMHTPETAPFPREHVERKWGPLKALGKHAAGRELDGRTWDQYPTRAAVPA